MVGVGLVFGTIQVGNSAGGGHHLPHPCVIHPRRNGGLLPPFVAVNDVLRDPFGKLVPTRTGRHLKPGLDLVIGKTLASCV